MQRKSEVEIGSNNTKRNENLKSWNTNENPQCLRIELSNGIQFMLPYGYFEGAKFAREDNAEILHLQFKSHQFKIWGTSLTDLFAAFNTLSVEWLKEYPHKYQALAQKAGGVTKIEAKEI